MKMLLLTGNGCSTDERIFGDIMGKYIGGISGRKQRKANTGREDARERKKESESKRAGNLMQIPIAFSLEPLQIYSSLFKLFHS